MAVAKSCEKIQADFDVARGRRSAERIFSSARRAEGKKVRALRKRYKDCKKTNSQRAGLLFAKGLARAAADSRVKFALKPGFEKGAGLFKTDNVVREALKVKNDRDILAAGQKFAKKHDLVEAAQMAGAVEALKTAMKGAKAGFITAQVGLAVMDVVATIVTIGGYAAAAPVAHSAVAAGQQVTISMMEKDIASAEQRYLGAIQKRKGRADLKAAKEELKQQEAATAEMEKSAKARVASIPQESGPWYARKEVIAAGVILTAATLGFAWSRRK